MRIGPIVLVLICLPAFAAETLDSTLNRLDKAGRVFKGMTAKMEYLKHTAIVNDNSTSTGTIKIKKTGNKILGLLDFVEPDKKVVSLNGDTVQVYLPNVKTVQEADLSRHKVMVEQLLLFGFGTTRGDLEKAYNVSLGGPETINGEATTLLMMTSKNPDVAKQITQFKLWLSDKTGDPVRQRLEEPSGDYNVFTYTNMHLMSPPDDSLKLNLPAGVKREKIKQ